MLFGFGTFAGKRARSGWRRAAASGGLALAFSAASFACKAPSKASTRGTEAAPEPTRLVPFVPGATTAASSSARAARADGTSGLDAGPTASPPTNLPNELLCMTAHYDAAKIEGAPGSYALVVAGSADRIAYEVRPPYRAQNPLRDFVVKDLFDPAYPKTPVSAVTDPTFDPGRIRLESLFRATYGSGRYEVEAKLVRISLGGHTIRVHERIREPMKRVDARIQELFKTDGQLRKYFDHMGGTYNYRNIAGTEQLSTHAFGIAIDLSTYFSHYWRNAPEATPQWKNSIPENLVLAFEAEGFIWGGRWYHYDTMHFEYRPELLDERCRGR